MKILYILIIDINRKFRFSKEDAYDVGEWF
jgi:hypothetical protein